MGKTPARPKKKKPKKLKVRMRGLTVAELAAVTGLSILDVTRAVKGLKRRGLVEWSR